MKAHQYTGYVTKNNKGLYKDDKHLFLNMHRPFKCTFLCLQRLIKKTYFRPHIEIFTSGQGSATPLGKIVCPCFCNPFKLGIEIYNSTSELIYSIEASKCQMVFCFPLPCESCQKAKFIVYDK